MPKSLLGDLFRFLRRERAGGPDLSDGALLERFLDQRDEAAFEALLSRHGPMVLGVCQRVAGDTHAAEDAFQATFFVLARKAGVIRKQASVASWLFGVAQRIACKARTQAATRREREKRAVNMRQTESLDDLTWQELRAILDEEIGALPAKYQSAIVLCHLEGKSYDQAAQELGCPKSTLARRLSKALDLLRGQLTRRGIALSAGALATALAEKANAASVPALVSINIVKAAASVAAGRTLATGILSTHAIALAEEAMKTMIYRKVKQCLLVLVILGLAVSVGYAGSGTWAEHLRADPNDVPTLVDQRGPANDQPPAAAANQKGAAPWEHGDTVRLASFLPSGKEVVTASKDGIIRVWSFPAGKEIHRIMLPEKVGQLHALSTDGKVMAVAKKDESEIYLFAIPSGKQLHVLKWSASTYTGEVYMQGRMTFSSDGKHLAALDWDGVVTVWDWANGKETRKFISGARDRGDKVVLLQLPNLVFAPDGKSILTVQRMGGKQSLGKLWDPATGKEIRTLVDEPGAGRTRAVCFSSDSKTVAICRDRALQLVETATGKEILKLPATQKPMGEIGLCFGKDGAKFYLNNQDGIFEYDVATGKLLREHHPQEHKDGNVSLSPDGTTLMTRKGSRMEFFDVTGKDIRQINSKPRP